jgi:hypothetical protein
MADEAERMAALIFAYYGDIDMLTARADAAEAEVAKWREMHADRAQDLRHEHARANALEVEVERLRAALAEIASGGCVDPARTAAEALGR